MPITPTVGQFITAKVNEQPVSGRALVVQSGYVIAVSELPARAPGRPFVVPTSAVLTAT